VSDLPTGAQEDGTSVPSSLRSGDDERVIDPTTNGPGTYPRVGPVTADLDDDRGIPEEWEPMIVGILNRLDYDQCVGVWHEAEKFQEYILDYWVSEAERRDEERAEGRWY
jgi:hypothetical protein